MQRMLLDPLGSRSVLLLFLFTTLLLSGCVSAYNTDSEEFVEGEDTCQSTGDEICDGIDNNCDGTVDEDCDDDGDGYCDSARQTDGTPAICPMGGGDCDDTNADSNPGAMEQCDNLDNNCSGTTDDGCDDDMDDFCDADMITVQDGDGNFPDVCPLGRDDCDDNDATQTSPIWYVDGDDDGYGLTDDFMETCDPPATGYAPLPNDCNDGDANVNPGATEICDDIDNNCIDDVDEMCDVDGDDYCDAAMTVSTPAPSTCPNGGGDCDDTRPEAYPDADEICNDLLDNCNAAAADEGCNDDGDDYCDDTFTTVGMPMVCTGGGGDCGDDDPLVNPGETESCGGVDTDCDGNLPTFDASSPFSVLRGQAGRSDYESLASDGTYLGVTYLEHGDDGQATRFAIIETNGQVRRGPTRIPLPGEQTYYNSVTYNATTNNYAVAYTAPDTVNGGWGVFLAILDTEATVLSRTLLAESRVRGRVRLFNNGGFYGVAFESGAVGANTDISYVSYDATSGTLSTPRVIVPVRSLSSSTIMAADSTYLYVGWYNDNTTLRFLSFRLNNGNAQATQRDITMSEWGSTTGFMNANDKVYVWWRSNTNGPSPYCCDYYTYVQEIRSSGSLTGSRYTLSDNDRGSYPIFVQDPSSNNIYYYHRARNTSPDQDQWEVRRFNSAWSQTDRRWMNSGFTGSISFSYREIPAVYISSRAWFADNNADNNYFTLRGFYTSGSMTDYLPISGGTFSSSFETNPRFTHYDETTNRYLWVQRENGNEVQFTWLNADGTQDGNWITAPVMQQSGFETWGYTDGELYVWTQSDAGMGMWPCILNVTYNRIDMTTGGVTVGSSYQVAGGDWCENESRLLTPPIKDGTSLVTVWNNYDFFNGERVVALRIYNAMGAVSESILFTSMFSSNLGRALQGPAGDIAVAIYSEGPSGDEVNLHFVETDRTVSAPVNVFSYPSAQNVYCNYLEIGYAGGKWIVTAACNDNTNDLDFIKAWVFDGITRTLDGEFDVRSFPDASMHNAQIVRAASTDTAFSIITSDSNASQTSTELNLIDSLGVITDVPVTDFEETYRLFLAGESNYNVVFSSESPWQRFTAYDDAGMELTSANIPLMLINNPSIHQFNYDDGEFRLLFNDSQRVLAASIGCL